MRRSFRILKNSPIAVCAPSQEDRHLENGLNVHQGASPIKPLPRRWAEPYAAETVLNVAADTSRCVS